MKPIPSPARREDEAEGILELERFLPYRLSVVTNRISQAIARTYARRFRLTVAEWRAMAVIGRFGAMPASAVCGKTQMDKVRVSRAVARLVGAGRLDRRPDPRDGRRTLLALTPEGQRIYDEIGPLALKVEARLLARLGAGDRAAILRLLARLEAAADAAFAED